MMEEVISQGAEAIIYKKKSDSDNSFFVIKHRFEKTYRNKEIDTSLRKFRTRREAKVLFKLEELKIHAPKLLSIDDKEMKISMEFIDGPKLRDVFEEDNINYSKMLGKIVAQLHDNDIIHHDLTTSNMILFNKKIYLIDFGLSFFSVKPEDKAVDLHLLRQALESKHYDCWKESFESFKKSYLKNYSEAEIVLKRLDKVEERGRNKNKH